MLRSSGGSRERYGQEQSSKRTIAEEYYRDRSPQDKRDRHERSRGSRSAHYRRSKSTSPKRRISSQRTRSSPSRRRSSRSKDRYCFVDAVGEVDETPLLEKSSCFQMDRYAASQSFPSEENRDYEVRDQSRPRSMSSDRQIQTKRYHGDDSPDNPFQDRRGEFGDINSYYDSIESSGLMENNPSSSPENNGHCRASPTPARTEIEPFSGDSTQSVREWLLKISDSAHANKWDRKSKIFQMTSKLTGYARSWYIGLEDTNLNWKQWCEKLTRAFPSEQDYDLQLQQMLNRTKQPHESYDKYFCHKMAMLNACDISGRRAVSCVVGGIANDKKVYAEAKKQNFAIPEDLYEYLKTIAHHPPPPPESAAHSNHRPSFTQSSSYQPTADDSRTYRPFVQDESARYRNKKCFKCRLPGHVALQCPRSDLVKELTLAVDAVQHVPQEKLPQRGGKEVYCFGCGRAGHYVSRCQLKATMEASCSRLVVSNVPVMQPEGGRSYPACFTKFYMNVFVNGSSLSGYIDLLGKYVTIRQEAALRLNLSVNRVAVNIEGFGNASIGAVGATNVMLRVDQAESNVFLYVIPDSVQAIDVIVGSSFLNLPQFVVDPRGDSVRLRFKGNSDVPQSEYMNVAGQNPFADREQGSAFIEGAPHRYSKTNFSLVRSSTNN